MRSPTLIACLAMLLLCALQLAFKLVEAVSQAETQGTVALAMVEQHRSRADDKVRQAATQALATAMQPMGAVLALNHCVEGQCNTVYVKPGLAACSGSVTWDTLCQRVPSVVSPGDTMVVSYDLRPAWLLAALNMGVTATLSLAVLWMWRRATRALEKDKEDAAPQLRQASEKDPLTGLFNRVAFEGALKRHNEAKTPHASGTDGCLLYFDLDRFKIINDTHGHIAGDTVLKTVTQRLRYILGNDVLIGRLGGDEFAALLTDVSSRSNIETICRVMIEQVSKPIQLDNDKDWVGLSIGAFMLKRGNLSIGEMLHRADLAMYEAKRAGRGRLVFFDESMGDAARTRAQVQADLKQGIEDRQLFMVYQPQFDAHDRIRGIESMVRWRHPAKGLIAPEEFIPVAEQSGLIVPLGKMVLDMVCADLVAMRVARLAVPYVSIHVSLRQLTDSAMVDDVQDALKRYGLTPDDIEFEVTESTAVGSQGAKGGAELSTLKRLSALSFRIAIDDFGSGYSSMGRLLDLKVDKLKIDGAFVSAIGKPQFNPALLELMIALAKRLGVKCVAEGVETVEQVAWLRKTGCHMVQGNFFAKPMTQQQLASWMKLKEGDANFGDGVWAHTEAEMQAPQVVEDTLPMLTLVDHS